MTEAGLRERRKQRTRDALFAAAMRLFREKGYAATTVAEIAAAAEVSTKTLFNHFAGKEDLLFAHRRTRIDTMHELLKIHAAAEPPAVALRKTAEDLVRQLIADSDGTQGGLPLNLAQGRLILGTPELRGRSLLMFYDAQRRLTATLVESYSDTVDPVDAAAAVGSLIGALQGVVIHMLDDGASPHEVTHAAFRAIDAAAGGFHLLGSSP